MPTNQPAFSPVIGTAPLSSVVMAPPLPVPLGHTVLCAAPPGHTQLETGPSGAFCQTPYTRPLCMMASSSVTLP